MEDFSDILSDVLIVLLLMASSVIGSIAKSLKKRRTDTEKRKAMTAGENHAPDKTVVPSPKRFGKRHDFPDTVIVDDGVRVLSEISYDKLREKMTDEEIAHYYPVEYERHLQELKLADIARRENAGRETGLADYSQAKDRTVIFEEGGSAVGKSSLHPSHITSKDKCGSPGTSGNYGPVVSIPDLSTPESARSAFIASEIFNRKYV